MQSTRSHLALIVPASNTVMEPDFHVKGADFTWTVSTWRIFLESVTREAEVRMLEEELPRCLAQITTTEPDLVVFGCTSAGSLGGLGNDRQMIDDIRTRTGASVVTVISSMLAELAAIGPRRVAVFTPYTEELTSSVTNCVTEAGYEIACAKGMGLLDNGDIGRVTPAQITDFVKTGLSDVSADCVFLSCTNWRAVEAIDALRSALDIPVLSSNQVTLKASRREVSSTPSIPQTN